MTGTYSPIDAKLIATTGTCGPGCGAIPINWSGASTVSAFSSSVTSGEIVAMGGALVIAASSNGTTYLYSQATASSSWAKFGQTIPGQLVALAADPAELAVATLSEGQVTVTTLSNAGWSIGKPTINASGVIDAGLAFTPDGATYLETVALSTAGTSLLEVSSSTNGVNFSHPVVVGNFSTESPNSTFSTIGQTPLNASGGIPGQLGVASVGTQLILLYTTNVSDQTVPATISSPDGGLTWQGPYFSGPVNGNALNPVVAVGPTGQVFASWEDPDYGAGAIEEATYYTDGMSMQSVATLPFSSGFGVSPTGAPAMAIDDFDRPLVLWPYASNSSGALLYSGAFLSPQTAIGVLSNAATESLAGPDLVGGGLSPTVSSILANLNATVGEVSANLSSGYLCAAQNLTAIGVYQDVTHIPLSVTSGSGATCASVFDPNLSSSPLLGSEGVDAPNTFLAVYADWALEAEGVPVSISPLSYMPEFGPYALTVPSASLAQSKSTHETISTGTATVTVTPTPYSPTAYELAVTDQIPGATNVKSLKCLFNGGGWTSGLVGTATAVTATSTNVSIDGGPLKTFAGTTAFPSVWVYNLFADQIYTWSATFSANLTTTAYGFGQNCAHTITSSSSPIHSMSLTGNFTTTLSAIYSGSPFITATYSKGNLSARLSVAYGTTLPATVSATLVNNSGIQSWSSTSFASAQSFSFANYSGTGISYDLSVTTTSRPGLTGHPGSQSMTYSGFGNSSPESVWASCQFPLTVTSLPNVTAASGGPYSSNESTTVDVTWYSNVSALGYITYYEVGTAVNWTISNINPIKIGPKEWEYSIELHGLEPWESYGSTYGVTWNQGCLTDQYGVTPETFWAQVDKPASTKVVIPKDWETDLAYDSITQTGGGILVHWNAPAGTPGMVTNGTAYLSSGGSTLIAPFSASDLVRTKHGVPENLVNLSLPLESNTSYTLGLELNYSKLTHPVFNKTGGSTFVYLDDSSGDGLTNAEKQDGWDVLLSSGLRVMEANPSNYSTNGLVSDYLEKEYGLDPQTIDTAHSHMLDTFNLTFDLGPASTAALPLSLASGGDFQYYYENSSYNFSRSCQVPTPNGGGCPELPPSSLNLLAHEQSDLTDTGLGAGPGWVGDGSPWATQVLWSASALAALESLITKENVGWLRAVTGHYGSDRTITVWGKLSWGADPLLTSTSGDGLADGNQPDPLGPVYVQVTVADWGTAIDDGPGTQAALRVNVTNQSGKLQYYSGWGPAMDPTQVSSSWVVANRTPYVVTIPITTSSQYAYYNVSMVVNLSESLDWWFLREPLSPVDLLNYSTTPYRNLTYCWSYANVAVRAIPSPPKANTLLLTPTNNSTLSNLPWGLNRYVGEPDFDLIVLNVTNRTVVSWIAGAGANWTYNVTLEPGLNNLLIPRGMFLDSPLGQALINNTNETVNAPVDSGVTFNATSWSSRSEASASNKAGNPNFIWVYSTVNQIQNGSKSSLFGGISSNPSLERGYESRNVQAVVWVNVSSNGYGTLTSAQTELTDLFGGLILNNTTGNVTGNLLNVTGELRTLGLPSNVLSALANRALPNDGSFGPPKYNAPPPSLSCPWYEFGLCSVFNTVSGYLTKLVTVIWGVVIAAAEYVGEAAAWLGQHLGITKLASQMWTVLKTVANAMEWAFLQLIATVVRLAQEAISLVWLPLKALISCWARGVDSSFQTFEQDLYAAANASGQSPGLNTATETSAGGFVLSLFGLNGIMTPIVSSFEAIMSTVRPFLQYFSLSWIASKIEQAIGPTKPLGNALQYVDSIIDSIGAAVASAIVAAVDYSGGSAPINYPENVPTWMPSTSSAATYINGGGGVGLPLAPTWLTNTEDQLDGHAGRVAVVESMGVATVLYLAWAMMQILHFPNIPGVGLAGFATDEATAILLTIFGWALLLIPGIVGYILSILVDAASVSLNIDEIENGEIQNELEAAIAGADFGADAIDMAVCASGLKNTLS
jgi:hypothetical protein